MSKKHIISILIFLQVGLLYAKELPTSLHMLKFGLGWANAGNIQNADLQWKPGLQGSRKGVSATLGWQRIGIDKVFYSPSAHINYLSSWSIGGAMNTIGVNAAPAGLGVYLTKPMSFFEEDYRYNRYYATFNINFASLQFGGNIAPDAPQNSLVPDPEAFKERLKERRPADIEEAKFNPGEYVYKEGVVPTQFYPFGSYLYFRYSIPIQFQFWYALENVAWGAFIEIEPFALEFPIAKDFSSTPTYDYSVTLGVSLTIL